MNFNGTNRGDGDGTSLYLRKFDLFCFTFVLHNGKETIAFSDLCLAVWNGDKR